MEPTYSDIYMLLQREPVAKQYFDTLPDYVREQIPHPPERSTLSPVSKTTPKI